MGLYLLVAFFCIFHTKLLENCTLFPPLQAYYRIVYGVLCPNAFRHSAVRLFIAHKYFTTKGKTAYSPLQRELILGTHLCYKNESVSWAFIVIGKDTALPFYDNAYYFLFHSYPHSPMKQKCSVKNYYYKCSLHNFSFLKETAKLHGWPAAFS